MTNIAIIPARGGSKRIPRKNIKEFLGKPIIAYSIKSALDSGLFSEVMVSTDDLEIVEIAQLFGAKVPFVRSAENSNDLANTTDVMREVIQSYEKQGKYFQYCCCIYPTAPFVSKDILAEAYFKLTEENNNVVFPVVKYSFPIQRSLVMRDGVLTYLFPEERTKRSQDLEPVYHDAGQFYFFDIPSFLERKTIISPSTGAIILSDMEVQDIDTLEDWALAELKYHHLYGHL